MLMWTVGSGALRPSLSPGRCRLTLGHDKKGVSCTRSRCCCTGAGVSEIKGTSDPPGYARPIPPFVSLNFEGAIKLLSSL